MYFSYNQLKYCLPLKSGVDILIITLQGMFLLTTESEIIISDSFFKPKTEGLRRVHLHNHWDQMRRSY